MYRLLSFRFYLFTLSICIETHTQCFNCITMHPTLAMCHYVNVFSFCLFLMFALSNSWHYVTAKPLFCVVVIHFVIFVITHIFSNYPCFILIIYIFPSVLFFVFSIFETELLEHNCRLFLCTCPNIFVLHVCYLILLFNYSTDCGIFCPYIVMSYFIFDNG
jgi:hypothetical protein